MSAAESPATGSAARRRASRLTACLALGLAACSRPAAPQLPEPLRVGVSLASGRPRATVEASYAPLTRHLGKQLGVRTELILTATADELNERFHRGEIDLANLGSIDFVRAEQQDGAVPLAKRTLDANFFCLVIAPAGSTGNFPEDFRGRSFAFGGMNSNATNRMRRFFAQMQIVPETFFGSVQYLGSNATVVAAIEEGRMDVGVVNGPLFRRTFLQSPTAPRRAREVWVSPPYLDAVWAMPARLAPELRDRVLGVFLALDPNDPAHNDVLTPMVARGFLPAARADFDSIRPAMASQGGKTPP